MKTTTKFAVAALAAVLALNSYAANPAKAAKSAPTGNADVEIFADQKNSITRFKNLMPPNVKTIACLALGSHPGSKGYHTGIELLRKAGYKVKVMPNAFAKPEKGKTSAPLQGRLSDFYTAWNDPEVDMILCIRGGRGCQEVMQSVDWSKLPRRNDLYVQGYSDVTMILCALLKHGYGYPIAGPMVGGMQGLVADALEDMRKMHHGEQVGPIAVEALVPGDCQGLPLAGLLSRFSWAVNTSDHPPVKGRIIFIESVSSNNDAIRQQFQTLLDAKFFEGAAGVVFCCFTKTGDAKVTDALLREIAPKLGVPVYMGFPFGHRNISRTIDYQRKVVIKNNQVTFPAK